VTIITRKEAREQSLVHYFVGEECKNGHVAERMIVSNACVDCIHERNDKFMDEKADISREKLEKREATKESIKYAREVLEYQRETMDPDSPESIKLLMRELEVLPRSREAALYLDEKFFYSGQACDLKGHFSKRWVKNGGCVQCALENGEWYRKNYKEEIRALINNRRARIKEAGGTFSGKDVARMFEEQMGECTGCFGDLLVLDYHVDHIMPISKGGSNYPDNLQLLCPPCNREKSAKLPEDWEKIAKKKRVKTLKLRKVKENV